MDGKYFQGRGPNTQAYTHSLEATHHVFMNLDSAKAGRGRGGGGFCSSSLRRPLHSLHDLGW